jgi:hypothetical protein
MNQIKNSKIGFAFGAALLGLASGCVTSRHAYVYAEPQSSVYIETGVAAQDDYIYYPAYQVYYSSYRRQYVYQGGRSWVSRPAPPHVSANTLLASPSVKVGFHDSPANHHAEIVRQYPKQWSAPNHEERRPDDRGRTQQ